MRIARCSAFALVLATGATLVTAACGGCTEAGCDDGVTVDVPAVRVRPGGPLVTVTVCVDGRCADRRGDSLKELPVVVPVPDEEEVEISVTVQRADGASSSRPAAPAASRSSIRTASDAIRTAAASA